jgi:hypothetical protein
MPDNICGIAEACFSWDVKCGDKGWECVVGEPAPYACEQYPAICCPNDMSMPDMTMLLAEDLSGPITDGGQSD